MELPTLTETAKHYPDCCLSLSTTLLQAVTQILADTGSTKLVLSIGSGSGLFESLLQQHWLNTDFDAHVHGVEVDSKLSRPVNIYLPEEAISTVMGTWDLTPRAEHASTLMFVYPRSPKLVVSYIERAAKVSQTVQLVIWLGPKVDWPDVEEILPSVGAGFGVPEAVVLTGLADYEGMMIMRRTSTNRMR